MTTSVIGATWGCATNTTTTPTAPADASATRPDPAPQQAPEGEKTLLVLGGTGFLGPHVVRAALDAGWTVTLFNRGKTNPHLFPELEKLQGDRDGDLKALEGRSWRAVIDTSGYVPRIVKASAELLAPSVEQYLFVSSISVYAEFSKVGMDESGPIATMPDPTSEDVQAHYGALKALCEQAAERAMPGRVTNIRPGLIVGPGDPSDRFTYWPVRIERGGEVMAPGRPEDPTQIIDARDLAKWMVHTLDTRTTGVFHATGPDESIAIGDLLETCKRVTGSDATFTWVAAEFLEKHEVMPWMHMPVWVPPDEPEQAGFGRLDISRAREAGLTFRPVEETIRDTLQWWKTLPEERTKTLRAGIAPEREAEVLAAWHGRPGAKSA